MIDTEKLRAVAKAAAPKRWRLFHKGYGRDVTIAIMSARVSTGRSKEVVKWTGFDGSDFPRCRSANARHIAAFDPTTALALLDELDAARAEVARLPGVDDGH